MTRKTIELEAYRAKYERAKLFERLAKHTELLEVNSELIQLTGTEEEAEELLGYLKKINQRFCGPGVKF